MTVIAMDSLMAVEKEFNLTPAETVGMMVRGVVPEKLAGTPEKVINERIAKALATAKNNTHEFHDNQDKLVGGTAPGPVQPVLPRPDPINPWLHPLDFLAARKEFNELLDEDEHFTRGEYKAYMDDGVWPARLDPKNVLETKMKGAEKFLGRLERNATETRYMSWGLFGAVTQFQQVFYDINNLRAAITDAECYANNRGLPAPETRAMARTAVRAAKWHVKTRFNLRGFIEDGFATAYHDACSNYLALKRLA